MTEPTLVDSLRKLAKALGVASDNAVRKAFTAGRLTGRCKVVGPDGKVRFDVAAARAEWKANTDARQQRESPVGIDAATPPDPTPARPPNEPKVVPLRAVPDPEADRRLADHAASNRLKVEMERQPNGGELKRTRLPDDESITDLNREILRRWIDRLETE